LTDCGTSGDLGASSFTISNLVITGTVVQGPEPSLCTNQPPSSNPPPSNPPPPPNPPTPNPPASTDCSTISLASDPNNAYWVEINAPQSAHVYAICTNGAQDDKYLSCAYNWGKWVCNPNGQECFPDSESPRYAVVNDATCRLNNNVPSAMADNEVEDASNFIAEFSASDAAIADTVTEFTDSNVADAAVADAAVADAAVADSGVFDAAVADTFTEGAEYVDSSFAVVDGSYSDVAFAVVDESTQQSTTTTSDSIPSIIVVALVLLTITAVGLFAAVIFIGISFRK